MFALNGYAETNVETIAKIANVNKATIYYYFKDKASLLFEIISTYANKNIAIAGPIVMADSSPKKRLEKLVINHVEFQLNDTAISAMETFELKNLPPRLRGKSILSRDRYESFFHKLIKEGIDEGDFIDVDSQLYTHFILGFLNSINIWYRKENKLSPS